MTLSRKQREIANRHALFLNIGKSILEEKGFHVLSMEGIAELAEYSKGTVYQHFTCKEEILIQLCNHSMAQLLGLFNSAIEMEGSSRDRIIAIFYANQVWAQLSNCHCDMLQHLSMHGVKEKVTDGSLEKHERLEQTLFGLVQNSVDQAIKDGDLKKHKQMKSNEMVFGLWSLSTGGQILQSSELPLEEFGISSPDLVLLRTLTLMLDGLDWQPLHNEAHFKKLLKRLETDVFAPDKVAQSTAVQNNNSGNTDASS